MEEKARFAVGIDIGTNFVRAVIGEMTHAGARVVGYGEASSDGMRRGTVSDIGGLGVAINCALAEAEKMSGLEIRDAAVSINGANITSTKVDGMISIAVSEHEIDREDLMRISETAVAGKIPDSRQILKQMPYEYVLDGQGGIREPLGMRGVRLEMRANVISTMRLDYENILKACDAAGHLQPTMVEPAVIAASRAVLTSQQKENGVAVLDLGGATTSMAIFDEGELQYVGVCARGSNDVTNDLAAYLKTVPDIAEEIKLRFVSCNFGETEKDITIRRGRDEYTFTRQEVDEVVESRLEEILEVMRKHLKRAGYDRRLPEGVILTGGGAKMKDIDKYVREQMELAVRIGVPERISGISEDIKKPEYATAIGLIYADHEYAMMGGIAYGAKGAKLKKAQKDGKGLFASVLKMFK